MRGHNLHALQTLRSEARLLERGVQSACHPALEAFLAWPIDKAELCLRSACMQFALYEWRSELVPCLRQTETNQTIDSFYQTGGKEKWEVVLRGLAKCNPGDVGGGANPDKRWNVRRVFSKKHRIALREGGQYDNPGSSA